MKTSGEIRALTGLRGIAACWVMMGHYRAHQVPTPGLVNRIIDHKGLAVDLFLMLSGFVLANAYGSGDRWRGFGVFVANRLARIYPLYLVTAVACFILYRLDLLSFATPDTSARAVLENLLMIQSWGFWQTISLDGPAWSISTEWAANLLFPLLAVKTLKSGRIAALSLGIACFTILAWMAFAYGGNFQGRSVPGNLQFYPPDTPLPLVRCIAEFAIGMLVWRCALQQSVVAALSDEAASAACVAAIACLLPFAQADIFIVALFAILLICMSGTNLTSKFLGSPIPRWLGLISFSIYLVHVPVEPLTQLVQAFLKSHGFPFEAVTTKIVVYGIPIGLSALTWTYIEKPLQRAFTIRHFQRQGANA